MPKYLAVKSMNYHKTILGQYDTYHEAKQVIDAAASAHRIIFGSDNSMSKTENSASNYPYRIEITEMTHEAGLITDVYYIERCDDDLPY